MVPCENEATLSVDWDSRLPRASWLTRLSFQLGRSLRRWGWHPNSQLVLRTIAWHGTNDAIGQDQALVNTRCAACSFSPINHKLIRSTRMEGKGNVSRGIRAQGEQGGKVRDAAATESAK